MPNVKVTLNRWWLRTGQRGMVGQSHAIDNQSHELTGESKTLDAIAIGELGDSGSINNPAPDIDNEHPEKMHLRLPRRIGRIERWWTRTRHFWKPELTAMEKEQLEQVRNNAHIRMIMVRQMMIARTRVMIPSTRSQPDPLKGRSWKARMNSKIDATSRYAASRSVNDSRPTSGCSKT